jgi:hypothetical protein
MPNILTESEWKSLDPVIREKLLGYINSPDRYQVNHIDENKENYHPSNLEWVTIVENQQKHQKLKKEKRYA